MKDNSKEQFINTWGPDGYRENWEVYINQAKIEERQFADIMLKDRYNPEHTCLEIGCGGGYWTDKYLAPNFKQVIALDVLPPVKFDHPNITYIELPDRNFECFGVGNDSIDFCFSFGVFCHLSLEAIQTYLKAIFTKLKAGGECVLYFSNNDRRPHYEAEQVCEVTEDHIQWVNNNTKTTIEMLKKAGFTGIKDILPDNPDSIFYCKKI
jgi:cyclopropane fatty-acyl-phospholipid synthase-like methyltransferase